MYMTPFHSPSTRKKGLLELETWLQGRAGKHCGARQSGLCVLWLTQWVGSGHTPTCYTEVG